MEYNSQKDLLVIPEYGRNMQGLIRHALTIEERAKRQAYIERLVNLMQQMHPQSRNIEDSKLKLWQHVIRIAEKDLEIDYPKGLSPEKGRVKPSAVNYPQELKRFRHYGKNVRVMITKAIEMEEGPIKQGFVRTIAGYMKMAYRNWQKESNISDEIIKADLITLSEGKLSLSDEYNIEVSSNHNKKRTNTNNSNGYRDNRRRDHRNSRNNRRDHRDNRNNRRRY